MYRYLSLLYDIIYYSKGNAAEKGASKVTDRYEYFGQS